MNSLFPAIWEKYRYGSAVHTDEQTEEEPQHSSPLPDAKKGSLAEEEVAVGAALLICERGGRHDGEQVVTVAPEGVPPGAEDGAPEAAGSWRQPGGEGGLPCGRWAIENRVMSTQRPTCPMGSFSLTKTSI